MTDAEVLQEHLAQMRAGRPLVALTRGQATAQALRLRAAGLPYTSIAVVMATYHGHRGSENSWRTRCRRAGAPPMHHPNGTLRVTPQMRRMARS